MSTTNFEFNINNNWRDNYNSAPQAFKDEYQAAIPTEKTLILRKWVTNAFSWVINYDQLDGLEDDEVIMFYLELLGTNVNEVAQAIMRMKSADKYSNVDKKVIELFKSNKKTGGFTPIDKNTNLNFDADQVLGGLTLREDINYSKKGVITFNELMDKVELVSKGMIDEIDIQEGELAVLVDTAYNQNIIIESRDTPIKLAKLTLTEEVARKIVGNSYIGKEVLINLTRLAARVRDTVLLDEEKRVSKLTLEGESLPKDLVEKYSNMSTQERVCPKDEKVLLNCTIESKVSEQIRAFARICNIGIGKYFNPKLPDFHHKVAVSWLACRTRRYFDVNKPVTRGHVLPQDVCKYLSEYKINECEILRSLYLGSLTHVKFITEFFSNLNDLNDYELNLIFKGAPGGKIFRFLLIVLLSTPSQVLDLEHMPPNIKSFYQLLMLLSYEDHIFVIKELITDDERLQGLVKNSLNYLIYWICRGHNEYIIPLFKLYSRFEVGAMYDSHKQILNMIDTQSFLLHEFMIDSRTSDPLTDEQIIFILNSMIKQSWFKPEFVGKFPRKINGNDMNELIKHLGYSELVISPYFLTKFKDINDLEQYEELVNKKERTDLNEVRKDLNMVDREVVRERFNIIFHRDLSTSIMAISLKAWNSFFSKIFEKEIDFTNLEFITNQHEMTETGGMNDNYGAGKFIITEIDQDTIKFTISDGTTSHEIDPNHYVKLFAGKDRKSTRATFNKDIAILNKLKSNYEKYKQRKVEEADDIEEPESQREEDVEDDEEKIRETIQKENLAEKILTLLPQMMSTYKYKPLQKYIGKKTGIKLNEKTAEKTYLNVVSILKEDMQSFEDFLISNIALFSSESFTKDLERLMKEKEQNDLETYKAEYIKKKAIQRYERYTKTQVTNFDTIQSTPEYARCLQQETASITYTAAEWEEKYKDYKHSRESIRATWNFFDKYFKEGED